MLRVLLHVLCDLYSSHHHPSVKYVVYSSIAINAASLGVHVHAVALAEKGFPLNVVRLAVAKGL